MKLPTKITPDRIRDSIVQVFFKSDIPFLPLIGYFHSYLSSMSYEYISEVKEKEKKNIISLDFLNHLFVNTELGVKISLHPTKSIIFNCTGNYIGWSKYNIAIIDVIGKFIEVGLIREVVRVGVRFTSEFPNINILEKVNFDYHYQIDKEKIKSGKFNIEYLDENNCRVILNIVSNAPLNPFTDIKGKVDTLSLIDIDIIKEKFTHSDLNKIKEIIFDTHEKQKRVFFSLLKKEFLDELNPEYD